MPRIDELWAYVAEESPGDEGVIGHSLGISSIPLPLVGADAQRMASLHKAAQEVANATGKTVRLVRFSTRYEVAVLKPVARSHE